MFWLSEFLNASHLLRRRARYDYLFDILSGQGDAGDYIVLIVMIIVVGINIYLRSRRNSSGEISNSLREIDDHIGYSQSQLNRMDSDPNNARKPRDADFVYIKNRTDEITTKIKSHDPDFHRGRFINYAKNVFSVIFNYYNTTIVDKETVLDVEDIYRVCSSESNLINGNYPKPVSIDYKTVFFSDYNIKDGFEYITVIFYVELFDAVYKEDPYRQFAVKFVRFTNNLVGYVNTRGSITCPNCGGNGQTIIRDGVCEYCGYKITLGGFRFVFADFKKILKDEDVYDVNAEISPVILEQIAIQKREAEQRMSGWRTE